MSVSRLMAVPFFASCASVCFGLVTMFGQTVAQESTGAAVDPSGTWRWEYDLEGTQFKDLVRLNLGAVIKDSKDKEVKGRYESSSGRKIEIRNGKVSGSKVTFDFNLNYQGMDIKLEFDGTIAKDSLTGTVHASTGEGSRDLPWTATRSVQADDVVGTWKMRIDANGTILEPVVTISKEGESLKASYTASNPSGEDVKIDVKELKIDKNDLCFGIDTEFQGQRIKADYRGRPYGDRIRGTIDYVLGGNSGEIDFTGARQTDSK
jgi:hypothetical protein